METFRRQCLKGAVVVASLLTCAALPAAASDFEMSLEIKSANAQTSVKHTEEQPSPDRPAARPVFTSESNEPLKITWTAINRAKQASFKDVLIHCVVVAEKEAGQPDVPDLRDVVYESALTMDFKPGRDAKGEFSLAIDEPGAYLVRVETLNMLEEHGHEHYVALDLVRK